jgi:hypothetical protein
MLGAWLLALLWADEWAQTVMPKGQCQGNPMAVRGCKGMNPRYKVEVNEQVTMQEGLHVLLPYKFSSSINQTVPVYGD